MTVNEIDKNTYTELWAALNERLAAVEADYGLGGALLALREQQRAAGFVREDLDALNRHRFEHPQQAGRFFSIQYNPRRAQRYAGIGRREPPAGVASLNGGCFLCRENIEWQQDGLQLGYDVRGLHRDYFALMNPYPLMPCHAVLVAREHVAQASPFAHPARELPRLALDLVSLAHRMPGFVGFYNGQGAGASIPGHLHFQFFRRPAGYGLFALESAVRPSTQVPGYPLNTLHWQGEIEAIAQQAGDWLCRWLKRLPADAQPSANLIASRSAADAETQIFVVPRDQRRMHAPGMKGAVGGLEVLGELVFSTEQEWDRVQRAEINYFTIESMLSAVSVPD